MMTDIRINGRLAVYQASGFRGQRRYREGVAFASHPKFDYERGTGAEDKLLGLILSRLDETPPPID